METRSGMNGTIAHLLTAFGDTALILKAVLEEGAHGTLAVLQERGTESSDFLLWNGSEL